MNWQFPKHPLNVLVQRFFALGVGATIMGSSFVLVAHAQPSYADFCAPQNSLQQDGIIVLGRVPNRPYVVIVPVQGGTTLDTVRACIPDAFESLSNLGAYINTGAFSDRGSAERVSRYFRSLNLDARVVYSQ